MFKIILLLVSVAFADNMYTVEVSKNLDSGYAIGAECIKRFEDLTGLGVGIRKYSNSVLVSGLLVGYPGNLIMMCSTSLLVEDELWFVFTSRVGYRIGKRKGAIVPNIYCYLGNVGYRVSVGILIEVRI